ncbi:MAG: ATP phosphoribosyltransferase [Candidatus Nezhaarchaeota archaeon]|nr:ATP phosphoribosyltransferase [Candidatus Nezhaarchaeota archaeon]MCX8141313.1 ATP phosphoribosyltransferase [Candidatus Nezhaarchaeota archaeon]MDW8049579.1 ATP phosphoribosyltransferase [Nitrososphaerota archaeon]
MRRIRLAIPSKGRLQKPSLDLLARAGLKVSTESRTYITKTDDVEVVFARAADIPVYVHFGAVDMGITGHDLVLERGVDVYELLDLGFGWCKMIVAVPVHSNINSIYELPQGSRIATSFPRITSHYFNSLGLKVEVVEVEGSVEVAPHLGLADAIVDLSSTGKTLKENNLKEIAVILESTARLICNKISFRVREDEVTRIVETLRERL